MERSPDGDREPVGRPGLSPEIQRSCLLDPVLVHPIQRLGLGFFFFFSAVSGETKREVFIFFSIGLLLFVFCFFYLLEPLYIDDLENILDEILTFSLNAVVEDNSIEEVPYFLIEGPI